MPFILGTAGHIDHGKTTLVRALTGIDCDRLDEEKKRGITIELGFAWMDLPDGQRLGIVDVPGHERFVRNMVAGAAGIDLVMMVIAADEGVMPQTREHLDICTLLGIRQGFVVLTKTDLVDRDWLALVREDVTNAVRGSFLEGSPILAVSTASGEGIEELKAYIAKRVLELDTPRRTDIFRLPVDRAFSLKGYGTIVTGTIISGRVRKDSDAEIMPAAIPTHIRTLQRHETETEEAEAGERCAANLQNIAVSEVPRGSILALPGTLFPSRRWIVRLTCLAAAPRALRHRTEVHFHHGTMELPARIHFFDLAQLEPGREALAEIRFQRDMTGVFGDHCVLRAGSPLRAAAGGMLLSPLPPLLRRRDPERARRLELLGAVPGLAIQAASDGGAALLEAVLELAGSRGADFPLLKVLTGLPGKQLQKAVQTLSTARKAVCFDREAQAYVGSPALTRLEEACLARAHELHEKEPLKQGFARAALEAGWTKDLSPRLVQKIFDLLIRDKKLEALGEVLRLPGREVQLDKRQDELRTGLLDACRKGHLAPPNYKDILASLQATEKEAYPVLRMLLASQQLVKVTPDLYFSEEAMREIVAKVTAWFATHDDLAPAGMKELFGLSRKFIIALLEYLDQQKITVRIGDKRQLRGANH